jgi:transposase
MKYKMSENQVKELEEALKSKMDQKASRRIQAVMMRGKGYKLTEVMDVTKFSQSTLCVLVKNYMTDGLEGLTKDLRTGNNRHMSFEEEAQFLEPFIEASAKGEVATVKEMFISYQEKLGKSTHLPAFYRMLKRHGWRKLMPRPHHPKKAGADELAASKKLTLKSKNN